MEFTTDDREFLLACGIAPGAAPKPVPPFDGTSQILQELGIPITRENYLMLAFAGRPPEEPYDGELAAELEDIMPLWFRNEEEEE